MKETVYHRFVFAIIRHLLTVLSGIFVTKGWIDAELANEFTTEAAMQITLAVIGLLVALYFSYKDKVWEFVKTHVAVMLPPSADIDKVAAIASTVQNKKEVAVSGAPIMTEPMDEGKG